MTAFPANPDEVASQLSTAGDEWVAPSYWPDKYALISMDELDKPVGHVRPTSWDPADFRYIWMQHSRPIANTQPVHIAADEMRTHLKIRTAAVIIWIMHGERDAFAAAWHDFDDNYWYKLDWSQDLSEKMQADDIRDVVWKMLSGAVKRAGLPRGYRL